MSESSRGVVQSTNVVDVEGPESNMINMSVVEVLQQKPLISHIPLKFAVLNDKDINNF